MSRRALARLEHSAGGPGSASGGASNHAQLGITDQDNVQEIQRRRDKATILREFSTEVKAFAKRAAYLSGSEAHSNQKLEQALELARQALARAEEDLEWMQR